MRSRTALALATVLCAVAGLSAVPSRGGQHFGLMGGRILTVGDPEAAAQAAPLGGLVQPSINGWFVSGVDAGVRNGEPGVFTMTGCVTVQVGRATDHGCVYRLEIPPDLGDPLLMQASVQMQIPSDNQGFGPIVVMLHWSSTGEAFLRMNEVFFDPNLNDPKARIRTGLVRNAVVNGFVQSAIGGGQIDPTPGTIEAGDCVLLDPRSQQPQPFRKCP